jgi:hypothetical protein
VPPGEAGVDDRLDEAKQILREFQSLGSYPGWVRLVKMGREQVERRMEDIRLTPLASLDAALAQEYEKGVAAGIELLLRIPEIAVEEAQFVVDQTKEKNANAPAD